MTRRVLILDQFCGVTPYRLQQMPTQFDALVAEVVEYESKRPAAAFMYNAPRVVDVSEDFMPPWATTVVAADEDGRAFVWKHRWDSSG